MSLVKRVITKVRDPVSEDVTHLVGLDTEGGGCMRIERKLIRYSPEGLPFFPGQVIYDTLGIGKDHYFIFSEDKKILYSQKEFKEEDLFDILNIE